MKKRLCKGERITVVRDVGSGRIYASGCSYYVHMLHNSLGILLIILQNHMFASSAELMLYPSHSSLHP